MTTSTRKSKINAPTSTIVSEKKIENKTSFDALINEDMTKVKTLINLYPIVLSTPVNGFTGYGFKTWKKAISFMKKTKCVYEDYNGFVKPYLDYDQKIEYIYMPTNISAGIRSTKTDAYEKKDRSRFIDKMNDMEDIIIDHLEEKIIYSMTKLGAPITKKEILFITSSGFISNDTYKLSLHVIINSKYSFNTPIEAKVLACHIKEYSDPSDDIVKHIDENVYKSLQKMRCIFSGKTSTDMRILKPINQFDDNYLDYMISYIDAGQCQVIDITQFTNMVQPKTRKVVRDDFIMSRTYDETDICFKTIQKTIDKVIPSANLLSISKDGVYTFKRDCKQKCPFGKIHERQNVYCVVDIDRNINIGCYSDSCKKIKNIGKMGDTGYFDVDRDNNMMYDTRYNLPLPGYEPTESQKKVIQIY